MEWGYSPTYTIFGVWPSPAVRRSCIKTSAVSNTNLLMWFPNFAFQKWTLVTGRLPFTSILCEQRGKGKEIIKNLLLGFAESSTFVTREFTASINSRNVCVVFTKTDFCFLALLTFSTSKWWSFTCIRSYVIVLYLGQHVFCALE